MRAPTISVAPDQAGEPTLNLHPRFLVALRLVAAVCRIEANHAPFAAEGLESGFLIVDQSYDDLAVARGVDLADQCEVAVENPLVDHRVAGHFERIMLARSEEGGRHGKALRPLQRLDRRSGRD